VRQSKRTYIGLAVVFSISLCAFFLIPANREFLEVLAGIPLVGALVGALYQLARDQAAYEKELLAAEAENRFVLGASSHMANVAFDKHVAFCEEYIKEAQDALKTLFKKGPSEEVLNHSTALYEIRGKHAVWLTAQLEKELEPFEAALREIGASAGYVEATRLDPTSSAERRKHIDSMFLTFAKVMAFKEWNGQQLSEELAISEVICRLRTILGVEELTNLRSSIVVQAIAGYKAVANSATPVDQKAALPGR
jgi:hypothetical protein